VGALRLQVCCCRWKGSQASWRGVGRLIFGSQAVAAREVERWRQVGRSAGRCRLLQGLLHGWRLDLPLVGLEDLVIISN
jgi:hypothetical protein